VHELAVAESVLEIASRHAEGRRVERVEVKIGELRQIVPAALELAFELLALGTALEGAELVIVSVAASGRCRTCASRSELEGLQPLCPVCGGGELELLSGEELAVAALGLGGEQLRPGAQPPSGQRPRSTGLTRST
jgi:hydrogenase nickel incorporation protein HypA/HybF